MKNLLFLVGGVGLALAYLVAQKQAQQGVQAVPEPVEELAHRLETAWADHHTKV